MNAVIYARYSSAGQTEQSIEGQLRVCKEYAERNGFSISNDYIDRATTGTNDNRPAFLQMIEDAERKEFQYIIVYKLDRFARNKYDSVFYKHKLGKLGIKVLSATEAISDTPEGRLVEGLLEMMAEMYSNDLSQKVKRGVKESLLKGNFIGGHILYGYKVENKKVIIDEAKAEAVKFMFEEYAKGTTKKQIVNELNNKGYRTNKGKKFTINSFQHSLSNSKYVGEYNINEIESYSYPAIIDKNTFDKVQARLTQNMHNKASQKAKEEYILTGKAYCGYCGSKLVGVSGTSKDKQKHSYYACAKQFKEHNCQKKYEKKGYLEWYVAEQTLEYVLRKDIQELIADFVLEEYEKNITGQKIKDYEKQITKLDLELDKCFNFLFNNQEDIEQSKRIKEKSKDLGEQKQVLIDELQKLKLASHIKHDKESIIAYLNLFLKGEELDIEKQKKIINVFVNSVYLFDDKIAIYYNLFGVQQVSLIEVLEDIERLENEQEIDHTNSLKNVFLYNSHRPAKIRL